MSWAPSARACDKDNVEADRLVSPVLHTHPESSLTDTHTKGRRTDWRAEHDIRPRCRCSKRIYAAHEYKHCQQRAKSNFGLSHMSSTENCWSNCGAEAAALYAISVGTRASSTMTETGSRRNSMEQITVRLHTLSSFVQAER